MIFASKKGLSLLAVIMAIVVVFVACRSAEDEDVIPDPPDVDDGIEIIEGSIGSITPDFLYEISDRHSINDHTVAWLDVPGTNISDVVVRNPECRDNLYYLRRNFYREYYFNGIFYIDFRADLGPTREYLGINTTIYGHAMTDDPEAEAFDIMFGNLHRFRDPEFMREHPYIFFSLPEDNLAFEIVAVFYGNSSNPAFSYNNNHPDPNDFLTVLNEEVLPRSLFHFDVEPFTVDDRFLTLSTCIYSPTGGVTLLHHSITQYRYAIIARLVDPHRPISEYVNFTFNEDRVVDPDGLWAA